MKPSIKVKRADGGLAMYRAKRNITVTAGDKATVVRRIDCETVSQAKAEMAKFGR